MNELTRRRKQLKRKFRNCEKVFGAWTSLGHPSITEIFCKVNFNFVGIDIEHSTISQEQAQRIIAAAQSCGSLCLPRVASHNSEMSRRLLDSGADGLIVPAVSFAKDAENIISWSKYPPLGRRGFGVSRAQGYGFEFDRYVKQWNESSILIAQIESIDAVNNIDSIIAFDEIDGVMVGPYDISGSLGIPGQIGHKEVIDAGKRIIDACKRKKKACGTQIIVPDKERIIQAFKNNYNFVILASDIFILWNWTQSMSQIINNIS